MINYLLGDKNSEESTVILEYTKKYAAIHTEEIWKYNVFSRTSEIYKYLLEKPIVDLACIDITLNDGIEVATDVRTNGMETFLILIADVSISPMEYIRPDIHPEALIVRPFTFEELNKVISTTVASFAGKIKNENGDNQFVIDSKEGRQLIPYDRINYFEARDKKIIINSENDEYSIYGTIEKLEGELPEEFVRCHRSYIVSKNKIQKIMFSQNMIELIDGYVIPLSRSYKRVFREKGE